jgi:hypothetical protein
MTSRISANTKRLTGVKGMIHELEATKLSTHWAVRPKGSLGTCGFHPKAWQVCYVKAPNAQAAIAKAAGKVFG